jgi:hypothetical protein
MCHEAQKRIDEFINRSAGQHVRAMKAEWARRDALRLRMETSDPIMVVGGMRVYVMGY